MAGVGHISVFGLGSYAKTFKDTAPALNKFITDSVRVSNQWLVGLSALVSSINYAKQKRLVIPLGYHWAWVPLRPFWWPTPPWASQIFQYQAISV
jgi:hypothetical protein